MGKSREEAYKDILTYLRKYPREPFPNWYCGITNNCENRLKDHNVLKGFERFCVQCASSQVAREVEQSLLDDGCVGGTGGGDSSAIYIYVYLKNDLTQP